MLTLSLYAALLLWAGGLTPDGGLPEWVHRRLDAAMDLHMLQNQIPPILCVGEEGGMSSTYKGLSRWGAAFVAVRSACPVLRMFYNTGNMPPIIIAIIQSKSLWFSCRQKLVSLKI
jgi:hypothetical protein